MFETVLFYAALWTAHNGVYLLAGLGTGLVILSAIAVLLLRSSARLPISQFFAFGSALVAVLAFVLIGKGMAALQKVGFVNTTPVSMPHIEMLGVYPTLETLVAQTLILGIIATSVAYNMRIKQ